MTEAARNWLVSPVISWSTRSASTEPASVVMGNPAQCGHGITDRAHRCAPRSARAGIPNTARSRRKRVVKPHRFPRDGPERRRDDAAASPSCEPRQLARSRRRRGSPPRHVAERALETGGSVCDETTISGSRGCSSGGRRRGLPNANAVAKQRVANDDDRRDASAMLPVLRTGETSPYEAIARELTASAVPRCGPRRAA